MGNEASRGLSPGGGLPPSPHTPTGAVRRTKSFSHDASSSPSPSATTTQVDRSIQRMDKTIRKRVRGGITYNMKIVLRGDRGTGKTSLFQRLKGAPIPATHEPTPQLQSATINWSFRANSEESVKCDVWDVVDKGFVPTTDANGSTGGLVETNPFESTAATATAAAHAQAQAQAQAQAMGNGNGHGNGTHVVATADATTVDVYHETHGVVFLLDVTKPHTLEYVRQQLDHVPVHIPTLVLGNFRDCGTQRKIFKEDIQELLYGGGTTQHQPVRRPQELLYFECSLLNCYGLKSLHQYFGIPFLQLKQQTIRQQLRIIEGEFIHLKHDLQAKIAAQKYAEYMAHIKTTGSDIRTGRRVAAVTTPAPVETPTATTVPTGGAIDSANSDHHKQEDDASPPSTHRLDRTLSSSSDIVIHAEAAATTIALAEADMEAPVTPPQPAPQQMDLEDLPERTAALAQAGNRLKIDYTEEERRATTRQPSMPPLPGMPSVLSTSDEEEEAAESTTEKPVDTSVHARRQPAALSTKPAISESDVAMNLEDFQVPKPRLNDLDSFYSDDESEEDEAGDDDDVVISTASARLAKSASAKYHKQQFLHSDDSDSDADTEKRSTTQRRAPPTSPATQRSPRRHLTTPLVEEHASADSSGSVMPPLPNNSVMPPLPFPVRPSSAVALPVPRSPTSPPHPTTSPQHSPRRRVKDIQSSAADENSDTGKAEDSLLEPPLTTLPAAVEANEERRQQAEQDTLDDKTVADQHIEMSEAAPVPSSRDAEQNGTEVAAQAENDKEDAPSADTININGCDSTEENTHVADIITINGLDLTEEQTPAADTIKINGADSTEEGAPPADNIKNDEQLKDLEDAIRSDAPFVPQPEIVDESGSEEEDPVPGLSTAIAASVIKPEVTESSASVDFPASIPSPPMVPMTMNGPGGMGDMLEAFLNDSDSESDDVIISTKTKANATDASKVTAAVADSDDDDEADDQRFAAYDMKRRSQRRLKPARRKPVGEMATDDSATVSLSSSQTSSFSATSESTTRPPTTIANQDVLAAIRLAEQDALRMLGASAVAPRGSIRESAARVEESIVNAHSSSRRANDDNAMDDHGSKKKPKKKKEKKSGTTSRSKRREMILTDEDE